MSARLTVGSLALAGFIGCVFGANWLIENVGTQFDPNGPHTLPVGFGERAPSGFIMVGISLTLRDLVQRLLGPSWTALGIVVGAVLSLLVADADLAVASGVTFLVAEALDFGVYTPLQDRRLTLAVLASNAVGAVVDSVLFLVLAFGWSSVSDFALGQIIGKLEWSILFLPLLWWARRWTTALPADSTVTTGSPS